MMILKGAVFDVDGVLVDTEGFQWEGWVEVLKPFGIPFPKEDYMQYAGKTGSIIERELIERFGLDVENGSLLKKKEQLLLTWLKSRPIRLLPYAREAVKYFKDRDLKVAVVSGAPLEEVELKLRKAGVYDLFEALVSRDDVKRSKPYPDGYLCGAKKLVVAPSACVAFEDTQYGVESAKSAGMACVAIPSDCSANQDFSRANVVVPSLKEACEWVGNTYKLKKSWSIL